MKKAISLLVVLAITLSMFSAASAFSGTGPQDADTDVPSYSLSGASCFKGCTVELYVSVVNNPGIISLRNTVSYDVDALELVSVEDLGLLRGYTTPAPKVTSPYTLRWADPLANENNCAEGRLAKLTFSAKETAVSGSYTVTVSHVEARTAEGLKVSFRNAEATVEIMRRLRGDADGDGEVTDWDAMQLERYLASWKVEIDLGALDADEDGEVTDWDAILLNRFLAGWKIDFFNEFEPEPTPFNIDALDYSEKTVSADDLFPYCKTQGRTIITDYKLTSSSKEYRGIALDYSAAAIEFNAYCEGTVVASFRAKSTDIGGSRLYLSVYVDGVQVGTSRGDFKLTRSTLTKLTLAEDLPRGLHTIRIERQTEAERGLIYVDSVKLSGELAERPADSQYFIEVIGDSITAGYGMLYPDLSDGQTGANAAANEYEDGTRTYAVLAAKAIGADYSIVAQQGIGVIAGYYPHTMLKTYTETCYQCGRHEAWTFPRKADVVVINLGTNDNTFCNNGTVTLAQVEKGIKDFIDLVRAKNPDAKILWAYGMMDTTLYTYIQKAIKAKGGAQAGLYCVKLTPNRSGGNGHPSLQAHIDNAKILEEKLKELLNIQ